MLQEMGVHVWSPAPAVSAPLAQPLAAETTAGAMLPPTLTTIQQPTKTPTPSRAAYQPTATISNPLASTTPTESASAALVLHPPRRLYPATAETATVAPHLGNAWLIVAEGRADTDPLAGDAGALLHNMLRALQLHQHPQVFFCGVELANAYQPHTASRPDAVLAPALAQIQPAMVLLMGRLAARAALGRTEPLGQLRAQPHSVAGYPAIVTYDAPYLLRQGKYKAAAWADLCHARHMVQALPLHRQ
ncbi:MAG: hypothetical protein K2Y10_02205 [Burkholderiaceae bacterium]|nr:hypothetical protein [Burkholderiaceae bacterium]